ncbi:hypothetical protein VP01_1762g1, partial [Puccinia sorghi]
LITSPVSSKHFSIDYRRKLASKLVLCFLSDLGGAMNNIPNEISNSICQKFYLRVNESIVELKNSEVSLSIVSKTIYHVRANLRESKPSLYTLDCKISTLVNGKFKNIQNILISKEYQRQSELNFLKQKMSGLEYLVFNQINSMNSLINNLNESEHHRNLPESMSPPLTHNNPLMNKSRFIYSTPPPAPELHPDETRAYS